MESVRRGTRSLQVEEKQRKIQEDLDRMNPRLNASSTARSMDETFVDADFDSLLDSVQTSGRGRRSLGPVSRRVSNIQPTPRQSFGQVLDNQERDASLDGEVPLPSPRSAHRASLGAGAPGSGANVGPSSNILKKVIQGDGDDMLKKIIKGLVIACAVLALLALWRFASRNSFKPSGSFPTNSNWQPTSHTTGEPSIAAEASRNIVTFNLNGATAETFEENIPRVIAHLEKQNTACNAFDKVLKASRNSAESPLSKSRQLLDQISSLRLSKEAAAKLTDLAATNDEGRDNISAKVPQSSQQHHASQSLRRRWPQISKVFAECGTELAHLEDAQTRLSERIASQVSAISQAETLAKSTCTMSLTSVARSLKDAFNQYKNATNALRSAEAEHILEQRRVQELRGELKKANGELQTIEAAQTEAKKTLNGAEQMIHSEQDKIRKCADPVKGYKAKLETQKDAEKIAIETAHHSEQALEREAALLKAAQDAAASAKQRAQSTEEARKETETLWTSLMGKPLPLDTTQDQTAVQGGNHQTGAAKEAAAISALRQNLVESIKQNEDGILALRTAASDAAATEESLTHGGVADQDVIQARRLGAKLYERKVQNLEANLARLRGLLQALDARAAAGSETGAEATSNSDELSEVLALRATVQRLRARCHDEGQAAALAQSKLDECVKTYDAASSKAASTRLAAQAAQRATSQAAADLAKAESAAKTCIDEAESAASAAKKVIETTKEKLDSLTEAFTAGHNKRASLQSEISKLESTMGSILVSVKAKVAEAEAKLVTQAKVAFDAEYTTEEGLLKASKAHNAMAASANELKLAEDAALKQMKQTEAKLNQLKDLLEA